MTPDVSKPAQPTNNAYTAKDIQVLGGREAVRRRPGMYIGSTDQRGLHHLIYEIVYNSVDEAMAGCCNKIVIIIQEDNTVSVEDNGRGIPVEIHPTTKKSALETVMTTLHAGSVGFANLGDLSLGYALLVFLLIFLAVALDINADPGAKSVYH